MLIQHKSQCINLQYTNRKMLITSAVIFIYTSQVLLQCNKCEFLDIKYKISPAIFCSGSTNICFY